MEMRRFVFLIVASACVEVTHAKIFSPIDYGAKGDGISGDTSAIRATLAAVSANKGGEVFIDKSFAFLTGGFNIPSDFILNVKGKILASQDSSDYIRMRYSPQYQPLVHGSNVSNITITGGGIIDGQGAPWWFCFHRENASLHLHGQPCNGVDRPYLIALEQASNVNIYDITLKDSPVQNIHLHECSNVHMHHMTVLAPWDSPNTDGFDIDCSVNILLENTYYSGGDDAVAVACFKLNQSITENVLVRNMTIGTSHGLSIGSGTSSGIRNVTFEHSTVNGSENGIRIKTQRGYGGFVRDVTYSNIQLYNVRTAIIFTLNYNPGLPPKNATYTPQIANININNVYSNGAQNGWFLDGLPESYIGRLFFTNVTMVNTTRLFENCRFAYGTCTNVLPSCPPCLQ